MTIHEIHFQPQLERVGGFFGHKYADIDAIDNWYTDIDAIACEEKLHSASWEKATAVSTGLTEAILRNLPDRVMIPPHGLHCVIDTRIHRLEVGHFPAVPGYHCDGWPRPDYHAQPDPSAVDARTRHWTGYVASDPSGCSGTEFIMDPLLLRLDDQGRIWEQAHELALRESPKTHTIGPGELWEFGPYTLHRARPAHTRGWRLWFRLSWLHHEPENLTPIQDQCYLLHEGAGW